MSDFITKSTTAIIAAPDPTKHVNYTYGMVLGVDDFTQEFAYLVGRDQWLARDLLGYGTVRGLQVEIEDDGTNGPRVSVKPGVALSPRGQLICVTPEQCASLNAWLASQKPEDLDKVITGTAPNETITLYVMLCYRDCPTDNVPIPGEPCRTEDEAMAASRWHDDFRLELRLQPPDQAEEDGLRDLVRWLRQIPVDPDGTTTLADFSIALRSALEVATTPPPPAFIFGTPDPALRIPAAAAAAYWREAFRIWITELRPRQIGQGTYVGFVRRLMPHDPSIPTPDNPTTVEQFKNALRSAAHLAEPLVTPGYLDSRPVEQLRLPTTAVDQQPYWIAAFEVWNQEIMPRWISRSAACVTPPAEECLLLAALTIPLTTDQRVDDNRDVIINEEKRPYVVHLRMLQEWLLSDARATLDITLVGDVTGPTNTTTVERIRGTPVDPTSPADQEVLAFDAALNAWKPAPLPVPPPPVTTLAGDVTGPVGATQITQLQGNNVEAAAPTNQQVLAFDAAGDTWRPATLPALPPVTTLAGDVTGPVGATQITQLQGNNVEAAAPTNQQVLGFVEAASAWQPVTLAAAPPIPNLGGDVSGAIPAATVTAIQNVPVVPTPLTNGQVLTVVNDQWQAAPLPPTVPQGDFVEHPPGLPRYFLVAAGIIQHGAGRPPVYNQLVGEVIRSGQLLINFGVPNERFGYRQPDESFMYIVKALPVFRGQELAPMVMFGAFLDNGILLIVLERGVFMEEGRLRQMEFMIEVSMYDVA